MLTRRCSSGDKQLMLKLVDRLHRATSDDDAATLRHEIGEMRRGRIQKQKFHSTFGGKRRIDAQQDSTLTCDVDLERKKSDEIHRFLL